MSSSRVNIAGGLMIRGALILILLLGILTFSCCRSSSSETGVTPNLPQEVAPEVGARAPDFTGYTLEGGELRLGELKGQKILLNFWTTWCPHCRRETPYLQRASEMKRDVKFIGVNMGEPAAKVKRFVRASEITFTIVLDEDLEITRTYEIKYIPTTFLIDEQGVIRQIKIGAFKNVNDLLNFLEENQG